MNRGYFGIGIYNTKAAVNVGTLWRSAFQLGASFIFTIGKRYLKQASDTVKAWRHVPMYDYETIEQFIENMPIKCLLVGIEMGGRPIENYVHQERAIYLLGAEDHGIPEDVLKMCNHVITIPTIRTESYNVAVAGSIVMYDRLIKTERD